MEEKRVVIKCVDMREDLQRDAINSATEAMELHTVEKDIAAAIKKHFDEKYKPTWHCIVGKNFGSYVTHESSHFIYFYIGFFYNAGPQAVLLFKSG